jgi:hypothetical protein
MAQNFSPSLKLAMAEYPGLELAAFVVLTTDQLNVGQRRFQLGLHPCQNA